MPQDTQKELGSATILHTCGGHDYHDEQSQGVHEDMPLAPVDLLGAVEPVVTTTIGRCEGLRVDHACARLPVTSREYAEVTAQDIVDPFPGTIFSPAPKIMIDNAPGRHIVGHMPPRTAGAQDIQDRIDNFPLGILLRSATGLSGRNQWCENLPFTIIEIGGIGLSGFHTARLSQLATLIPLF